MLDNTCVPNMCSTQFFDFTKCFESKIRHFSATVGDYISIVDAVVIIVAEQPDEHLIDNYFIFVIHIE